MPRARAEMDPRPFFVQLYPRSVDSGELEKRIPPHRLILEPLLEVAVEVAVHGRARTPGLPIPPGTRNRSVLYLDLNTELIRGWEWFWNASRGERGAVSIVVPRALVDWAELFSSTEYGGVWGSRWQLSQGTPTSAINYADKAANGEFAVVSLSASNGIQRADVWSDLATCHALHGIALAHCRKFVRWVENGTFARELIYDRPPYKTMV